MPSTTRSDSRAFPRPRFLPILALTWVLAACAGMQEAQYVYESEKDFVRLEPIENGAPANAHPFPVSADQMHRLLRGLAVGRATSIGIVPLFSPEELESIAAPLATALSKARPDQDVTFAVSSYRGLFGQVSPRSFTTGRLFARDDKLHLIFGLVQARPDFGEFDERAVERPIVPGTRARRIEGVWEIKPRAASFHEGRGDWLVFDRSAIPAARETAGEPAERAPAADSKAREIENRLRTLDALRERGAISEEEYRQRRRAILEQL